MTEEEVAALARALLDIDLPSTCRAGVAEQIAALREHAHRVGVADGSPGGR